MSIDNFAYEKAVQEKEKRRIEKLLEVLNKVPDRRKVGLKEYIQVSLASGSFWFWPFLLGMLWVLFSMGVHYIPFEEQAFSHNLVTGRAKIINMKWYGSGSGYPMYRADYTFTHNGETFSGKSYGRTKGYNRRVGHTVNVRYRKDNPELSRLVSNYHYKIDDGVYWVMIFTAFLLMFLVLWLILRDVPIFYHLWGSEFFVGKYIGSASENSMGSEHPTIRGEYTLIMKNGMEFDTARTFTEEKSTDPNVDICLVLKTLLREKHVVLFKDLGMTYRDGWVHKRSLKKQLRYFLGWVLATRIFMCIDWIHVLDILS